MAERVEIIRHEGFIRIDIIRNDGQRRGVEVWRNADRAAVFAAKAILAKHCAHDTALVDAAFAEAFPALAEAFQEWAGRELDLVGAGLPSASGNGFDTLDRKVAEAARK